MSKSEKAVIATFECPECGNEIEHEQVLKITSNDSKFQFEAPKVCASCGRKSGFVLRKFISGNADVRIQPDY